jgi:uncharacterized protein YerC
MKLPVLDTYAFPVTLPSTGKTITMRPYLVREEKLLLMAQESDDYQDQVEAIAQIIRNCTNDQVNPRIAPYFDIEYLLLQLRARSVGETTTPIYVCHNKPNGGDTECGHRSNVSVNLTEIPVANLNQPEEKFLLKLSDRYTLKLRYPTVYTIHQLVMNAMEEGKINSQPFMEAICDVFDTLENHDTGEIYAFADYTTEEKMQFLESLSTRNYEELVEFLDDLPTVEKIITFTCEGCGFEHNITLSGVVDFLD